ncbi:MAG: hypothetical protein AAF371_07935 [Pseudomonadota bacterium]
MPEPRKPRPESARPRAMRTVSVLGAVSAFLFVTALPDWSAAQSSLPRGRTATTYGGGSGAEPYQGRSGGGTVRGRTTGTYSGGRAGTIYNAGDPFPTVGQDAIKGVNDGLREDCESQLREKYGADKVSDLDLRRRDSDNKRIYTTITRPDGTELSMRCVVRNGRLASIETGGGDSWDDAEEYERPPEEQTTEEGTAEGGTEGEAAPEDAEERADGETPPAEDTPERNADGGGRGEDGGDGQDVDHGDAENDEPDQERAEQEDGEAPEKEGETAEAEPEPSGPKRIKVPSGDAPRL